MQAQAAQELARLTFLRDGQTRCDLAKPLHVNREHLIDQCAPLWRQLPEDNPLVFFACSSTHQTTVLELFHDVRRAGPRDKNPIPNLAQGEYALVIEHLEHCEFGQAKAVLRKVRPDASFDRLERAAEGDHQLERRRALLSPAVLPLLRLVRHG